MALPDNILSTTVQKSQFIGAKSLISTRTVDYEDGGIGVEDPTEGLLYQRWRCRLSGDDILLSSPNTPEYILFSEENVTELAFTFDQSMHPIVVFIQAGITKLRWFDSTVPGYIITTIGSDLQYPKITMDNKHVTSSNGNQTNDVILAYVRTGNLYYRQQRDSFTIERLLASGITTRLKKIGMSKGMRLQFMFEV